MAGERKRAIARWWLGATRLTRVLALMAAVAATVTVVEVATGAYAESGPTNDLFAIGQGSGDTPATVPIQHPGRAAADGHATRALWPWLEAGAGRGRPRAGRVGREQPQLQRVARRPPGHRGRLQGVPLHRHARARVRLLRHHADVPAERAQPRRRIGRGGGARHVRSVAPGADGHAHRRRRCSRRTSR